MNVSKLITRATQQVQVIKQAAKHRCHSSSAKVQKLPTKDIQTKLADKETVIVAEGYVIELERRGFLKAGSFVPEVVINNPEKVEELSREFVHAGSDIVQAFTYYAHRQKMKDIGKENDCDQLNRKALEIAKKVARETGTYFCSSLTATNVWDPKDESTVKVTKEIFEEQVKLSSEYGVDYIVIETIWDYGESSLALKICNDYGLPTVVTLAPVGQNGLTFDGVPVAEALRRLEQEGAVCVGLNCARGPQTMIPFIRELRDTVKGPLATVSLAYRTSPAQPSWYHLRHPDTQEKVFPENLSVYQLGQSDVKWYAEQCKQIGVEYVGFCCGNSPHYMRTLAESYGRTVPASRYSSDFHKNSVLKKDSATLSSSRYTTELGIFCGLQQE